MDEHNKQIDEVIDLIVEARKAGKITNKEATETIGDLRVFKYQVNNLEPLLNLLRARMAQKLEEA